MNHKHPIGTQFIYRKVLCTVSDLHTTYNHKGEVVSITYCATHQFLNQTVEECEIVETTVSKGLVTK